MAIRRITRIGISTAVTNYTVLGTESYVADDPAGTTGTFGVGAADIELMDQELETKVPPGSEVAEEGAQLTFALTPDLFDGLVVKIRPTFTSTEFPFLELWTQDATSLEWQIKRRIAINNPISSQRSAESQFYELLLASGIANVGKVWVTMNPGVTGAPTMRFSCIHAFGVCTELPVTPDPDGPDLPPPPIVPDDAFPQPAPVNRPPFLPPENNPFTDPEVDIEPLNICDPDSIETFRALLTPAQELLLDEILANATLPCDGDGEDGPEDPINTQDEDEPFPDDPINPFNPKEGPIVDPISPDNPADPDDDDDEGNNPRADAGIIANTDRLILSWHGADEVESLAGTTTNVGDLVKKLAYRLSTVYGNYGPASGVPVLNLHFTPAAYAFDVVVSGLPPAARIGFRMKTFDLRGSVLLTDSIDDSGVRSVAQGGGCPALVDWFITDPVEGDFTPAVDAELNGEGYLSYVYAGPNNASRTLRLALPRVTPAQNDFIACDPGDDTRSLHGHHRTYCATPPNVEGNSIWIRPFGTEDFDNTSVFDIRHVTPRVFVLDVSIRIPVGVIVASSYLIRASTSVVVITDTSTPITCP